MSDNEGYICNKCGTEFSAKRILSQHMKMKGDCVRRKTKKDKLNVKCEHCGKGFACETSIYRHVSKCKNNNSNNSNSLSNISRNKGEISVNGEGSRDSHNTTTTDSHNTTNIIIPSSLVVTPLVNFGDEDINTLDKEDIDYILSGDDGNVITRLVERMYTNPKYPQYHNILYNDKKARDCLVFRNDKWQKMKCRMICDLIIRGKTRLINDYINQHQDDKDYRGRDFIKEYLSFINPEITNVSGHSDVASKRQMSTLRKHIKRILYENRMMIKRTKRGR